MSLRARIALGAALAVAIAVVVSAFAVYQATGSSLRSDVDRALKDEASRLSIRDVIRRAGPDERFGGSQSGPYGGAGSFVQLIDADGVPRYLPAGSQALPVSDAARQVAAGEDTSNLSTVRTNGLSVRVLTVQVLGGGAVQVARPLTEVDATLSTLRGRLAVISLAGIGLAGILGMLVAARGVRPVTALAASVDHVARTGDLSHRIAVEGDDEPAQLARRFNEMLDSIEQARDAQDRLVADASHELRTPLTALRANVELLASGAVTDQDERAQMWNDLTVQLDGVGALVGDLVELARGDRPVASPEPLDFGEVVHDAVARARAFWPAVEFSVAGDAGQVDGDVHALGRAVGNLLDNAAKYGEGRPVEVTMSPGTVVIRDFGPGVPSEDRDRVFTRFWRSPEARARQGSGLGLAIVRQVATAHGGTVTVNDPERGAGAQFTLSIPPRPPE
ncbi:MAG: HAMP domain-containing histidine kinase [Thermoleophilia bacterium]|nr:HAMP domain-containing histidine kinase [Thermoleophilia bacterium]